MSNQDKLTRKSVPTQEARNASLELTNSSQLYQQPSMSYSTPAIGQYPTRILKRQSKSFFNLFSDSNEKNSEKRNSLLLSLGSVSVTLRKQSLINFGSKKSNEPIQEEVDNRYKRIDFEKASVSVVRDWDSLSIEELRSNNDVSFTPTMSRRKKTNGNSSSISTRNESITSMEQDITNSSSTTATESETHPIEATDNSITSRKMQETLARSLEIHIPHSNFESATTLETFKKPISISPLKITPISGSPPNFQSLDWSKPRDGAELYDMKKWLLEKDDMVTETLAVSSVSPVRSPLISKSPPKFLSLDWNKKNVQEEDLFDMKKWVLTNEPEIPETTSPSLVKRKSIKRSHYSDTYVAISVSDTDNNVTSSSLGPVIEASEEQAILNSTTSDQTVANEQDAKVTESSTDQMNENTLENKPEEIIENNKVQILNASDNIQESSTNDVVPDTASCKDVTIPQEYSWPTNIVEPEALIFQDDFKRDFPDSTPDILTTYNPTLEPEPSFLKSKLTGWGWFTKLKLFSKKQPLEEPKKYYPEEIYPSSRLEPEMEKEIYALSHMKLAQVSRPLIQQVTISNLMLYILSVHSAVTIRGRGPKRPKGKKRRRKRQQPLINPTLIEKTKSVQEESSSEEENAIESDPLPKLKNRPAPLLNLEDDEDDIPLAILQKTPR